MLADSNNIVNRWKNYFCQPLKVQGVHDFRQTKMHTVQPLVPEVEIDIEKWKRYKSPHTDQTLTEMIQARTNTLHFEVHTY
jgi:hypothetical protein